MPLPYVPAAAGTSAAATKPPKKVGCQPVRCAAWMNLTVFTGSLQNSTASTPAFFRDATWLSRLVSTSELSATAGTVAPSDSAVDLSRPVQDGPAPLRSCDTPIFFTWRTLTAWEAMSAPTDPP